MKIIKNGFVVLPDGMKKADIGIENGNIASIGQIDVNGIPKEDILDAEGLVVLPGLIDMHVHMRDPGATHKEDAYTGTCCAAAGGVTTIGDMPNNLPPLSDVPTFKNKQEIFSKKAVVDYGFYVNASAARDARELKELKDLGAIGIKLFMEEAAQKGSPYGALTITSDWEIWNLFQRAAEEDMLINVHTDTPSITNSLREVLKQKEPTWEHYYTLQNSPTHEATVGRLLAYAVRSGARLHIAHIPTAHCIPLVKLAKQYYPNITADCCVPAISLDMMKRLGAYATPYGRPEEENEMFWDALADGTIDAVITDHAPHTREEKDRAKENMWFAPPGVPGLETLLAIMLDRVAKKKFTFEDIARVASANPAKILRIDDKKGSIEVGKNADFAIVDPKEVWTVKNEDLYTKCGFSPFDGEQFTGRAIATILRGEEIMNRNKVLAGPGFGHMVVRK